MHSEIPNEKKKKSRKRSIEEEQSTRREKSPLKARERKSFLAGF